MPSSAPKPEVITPTVIYDSVRQEILDQKKCQFQIFGAALTITAAVLAYAGSAKVGPLVYVAPVLMNVLALTIILEKAISIQRMVGYLQLMEQYTSVRQWMWEYHLNQFREEPGTSEGPESYRKHKYIRNVALMLVILSLVPTLLCILGPNAIELRQSPSYEGLREVYGAIYALLILLNLYGVGIAFRRWKQLVQGEYTSKAIRARWLRVINKSNADKPHLTS